jgi:hypothetical protein
VTVLVLDEHLTGACSGLAGRGIPVKTVHDFNAGSTADPTVIRTIADKMGDTPWVFVTLDGTLVDEHRGFDWERYAIAWIVVPTGVLGIAFEHAKVNVIQRHAHRMSNSYRATISATRRPSASSIRPR